MRWHIFVSVILLGLVAGPALSAPKLTTVAAVGYRDCGLGVVRIEGIHSITLTGGTATELGKRIEVLGELWQCRPFRTALTAPCVSSRFVLGAYAYARCTQEWEELCRVIGGTEAWTSGGVAPHLSDLAVSSCKVPACIDDYEPPQI